MTARMSDVTIRPTRLTPTEAVLAVELHTTMLTPTMELRGRLMGPNCLYSTTIEVAHPIRMTEKKSGHPATIRGKLVIPEPAWWDPQSPFLYHGPIEFWEHEHKIDETRVRIGLCHAKWQGEQLIWNGKPLALQTQTLSECDEPALRSLRERGFNGVILPPVLAKAAYPVADRIGLLIFSGDANVSCLHPSAAPQPTISANASAN